MGIRVALRHITEYSYDRPVSLDPHVVRLRPAPHTRTNIVSYSLKIEPNSHFINWQQDPYSNHLARLVFKEPTDLLRVTVDLIVELNPINPFNFFVEKAAEFFPFEYESTLERELAPYLETLPPGPELAALVEANRRTEVKSVDFLVDLNQQIQQRIGYVIRMEPGVQDPEFTLTRGKGSCRDSAWLLVQLCRNLGLAARFCSGYLIQLAADEAALDGPSGPTEDFTDLHAWTEVYLPGAGWIGVDPTSGLLASEGHIPLASTASPQSAAPVSGSFSWLPDPSKGDDDKVEEGFNFEMSVTRINEMPRVTKPYTDTQWAAILKLGQRIDADLAEWDVRLTMGGEPTFISIDDRDGAEWNMTAVGPTKRKLGTTLLKKLRDQFAPKGLLHFGQGKQYPGEQLPRWAFTCYWRRDGEPIWTDPSLVGDENTPTDYTAKETQAFITTLAEKLGVDVSYSIPAFEDAWYYLWRERGLPTNVDPLKSKLEDPLERDRIAKVFEQGLNAAAGYVLPLRRSHAEQSPKWESGPWKLRRENLYLLPGNSPMGYRLPLDSLSWEAESARQFMDEADTFSPKAALPTRIAQQSPIGGHSESPEPRLKPSRNGAYSANGTTGTGNGVGESEVLKPGQTASTNKPSLVRTALCVESRDGRLFVFMPPARFLEDYLDLVHAIEATAAATGIAVILEGYKPPQDARLNSFSVTPDPGVIEVNVQPASDWNELVNITETVYAEAKQTRLTAEKFMTDGRHCGTGGGNHMVMGGSTPADSPFLRRPDLLRSFVGYWNNHPSLSYLFSGLFIGPTSQHPRLDEARHDSLYELDIANKTLSSTSGTPPAWLVDRLYRHLLVDSTGNTHRTEFCIDKLYNPDTTTGRLGLVELRSFEMPPHYRMSCAQQLMLRAFVNRFWKQPYQQPLVRWGTELHDKFMLPHFVEQDFLDVLDDLKRSGSNFDPAWFTPHLEFRFPLIGTIAQRGLNMELRTAIEPWHVLGEENGGGGAVRYVDSSVERLQIKVRGMTDPRHVLTCNGRRLPMHPTGTNGEYIAGVRFRAWHPPSCLHPTIPAHGPLVFDLLDVWNDRSIGGCTYHVAHPGGKSSENSPVNDREAEGRRIGRFYPFGHTPGSIRIPPPEELAEFPYTLDMRQPEPLPLPSGKNSTILDRAKLVSRRIPS